MLSEVFAAGAGWGGLLRQAAAEETSLLFAEVKDADLIRLGIDADVLPLVRLLASEAHLQALANLLPAPQFDALTGLAAGMSPEQVWGEVSASLLAGSPPDQVDTDDLTAAAARTPDRFVMVSGPAELADILAHPFDAWRVFLHPTQREVAYRPSYAGPALITGGAGTGKTVTALHRAVFLAGRAGPQDRILLTTFTRNLAEALDRQLGLLTDDSVVRERIEVLNVDRLAYRVAAEALGRQPGIADQKALGELWDAAAHVLPGVSPVFLQQEWEQVILAQDLRTPEDYLSARRPGRGTPLRREQRLAAWEAIRSVTDALRQRDEYTHLQLADLATTVLAERPARPYQQVIVDEGQDLHPAQWRLLRAAVHGGPDDLFIVSDPHQRIYDNQVSLVNQINRWLDDGIEPHAIGVAARNSYLARGARDALSAAGLSVSSTNATKSKAVRVGSMHSMKGLEFRCLAAIGVDAGIVPAPSAVTAADVDPMVHQQDLQRERCILFVACTRARDSLYVSYVGSPSPFLPAV